MKKTSLFSINLMTGLLLIFFGLHTQAQELSVKINGIRSVKGNIVINVFKDQASYNKEEPDQHFTFDKKLLSQGMMTIKFILAPGVYGITLLDDENGNGKIDKNFLGIPKEGFGFSNFLMAKMKKPSFDDFKVDLNAKPKIEIQVKYM